MSEPQEPLDLAAVNERREAALRQVFGLCGGTATFTISVPPQETDSDVLLCAALKDSMRLEVELTGARDEASELRAENERLREALNGLLNALPSATTHPAISAAVEALRGKDEQ